MYSKIISPIDYGGIKLKNRIIFAPTRMKEKMNMVVLLKIELALPLSLSLLSGKPYPIYQLTIS